MEIKKFAGKCECNRRLKMMFVESPKDMEDYFWICYGFCKKCEIVYLQGIFDKKPIPDIDFVIDYNKVAKGTSTTLNSG